jgi:putative transposase
MPRIARGFIDGFVYHVINRGNGGQTVFHENRDYQTFIDIVKKAKRVFGLKLFAYCLMPSHFHMVVLPARAEQLSKWMQWVMTSYVRRYHHDYGTKGHLWQGRFKSFIVQQDEHLLRVMGYVESNPVRAGLVNSAKEWYWSSHRETLGKRLRTVIDEIPIELPKGWESYVHTSLAEKDLKRVRESVNRQSPYGTPVWVSNLCKELGIESTIRPRGRPKKVVRSKKTAYPFFTISH